MNNPVDFTPDLSVFKKEWLPLEQAIQRVAKFEYDFGKAHLSLACHAALASILTPELVNLIRINFLEKSVEWIAESDLLLSSLCFPIHQGIFEIEPQIRQVLLVALQKDPVYGAERLEEIASFLYFYNESPLASNLPKHIKRTYQWISSAYLDPDLAVQNMANFLESTYLENSASRTVNYQFVGKTLAMLANLLEISNLQVELDDLVDSTYLVLQSYAGQVDFSALLQHNSNTLDETIQPLTSSVVDWLLNPISATSDSTMAMPTQSIIPDAKHIPITNTKPVTIFCSYSHKDEHLLRELEKYLMPLQKDGLITYWHDRLVPIGVDPEQEIHKYLSTSQIILLLVSADFLASDYCYKIEMLRALERDRNGEARVIPIILRPSPWKNAPFAHLQVLPTNARPITSWSNRDEAFADVVMGLRQIIADFSRLKDLIPAVLIAGPPHAVTSLLQERRDSMGPDYELGVQRLKTALLQQSSETGEEFEVLNARLKRNLYDARLYGDDQANTVERNKILGSFIQLTSERLNLSFNDLCNPELEMTQPDVPLALSRELATTSKGKDDNVFRGDTLSRYKGTQDRWAVLVGVDTYKDQNYSRLRVCKQDLNAVTQQLSMSGFSSANMSVLADRTSELPTRENILTTLRRVAQATKPDDLFLFYYTGHGDVDGHESYLVANNGYFVSLKDTAVAITRVKEIMQQAAARAKVLILDACHGGVPTGAKGPRRMSPEFIDRVFRQAQGIAVLSSCTQDQISYEWQKQSRSVFTYYLLEALQGLADNDEKGFVTVADIHRYVSDGVVEWAMSNKKVQVPTLHAEMAGEIIVCYYGQKK